MKRKNRGNFLKESKTSARGKSKTRWKNWNHFVETIYQFLSQNSEYPNKNWNNTVTKEVEKNLVQSTSNGPCSGSFCELMGRVFWAMEFSSAPRKKFVRFDKQKTYFSLFHNRRYTKHFLLNRSWIERKCCGTNNFFSDDHVRLQVFSNSIIRLIFKKSFL